MQGSLVQDNGHSLVPSSEKKLYSIKEDSPQGIWDNIAEKMLVEFAESGCPIFRATTPLSRCNLKSKGHGRLPTIETIFRIIVSANQLSLYGAVAEMCEEYESLHDTSGRPDMVMGQSLLQHYGERIEKLSQQDKLSKFCMDAGFQSVLVCCNRTGGVNTTPQMTCFSRCKKCAQNGYREKVDDQIIQPDNKLEMRTIYKLKLGPR